MHMFSVKEPFKEPAPGRSRIDWFRRNLWVGMPQRIPPWALFWAPGGTSPSFRGTPTATWGCWQVRQPANRFFPLSSLVWLLVGPAEFPRGPIFPWPLMQGFHVLQRCWMPTLVIRPSPGQMLVGRFYDHPPGQALLDNWGGEGTLSSRIGIVYGRQSKQRETRPVIQGK